jgi:hypothetical protein
MCNAMSPESPVNSVDVCVHATGRYIEYARLLAPTLDRFLFPSAQLRLVLFTDQIEAVEEWPRLERTEIVPVAIQHRSWPDSTLLRFSDYSEHREQLHSEIVVFLDADMELRAEVGPELSPSTWQRGIALVLHPGFFDPPGAPSRSIFRRARNLLTPRGSWESSTASLAYIPEAQRVRYVCGGVWMGHRQQAVDLCELLARRIDQDADAGVLAVWHDESHLNWWAANHESEILVPEYCYAEGYENLTHLTARIVAIEKPTDFVVGVKG